MLYIEHESTKVPYDEPHRINMITEDYGRKFDANQDKISLFSAWTFEDIVRIAYIRYLVYITTVDVCRTTLTVLASIT